MHLGGHRKLGKYAGNKPIVDLAEKLDQLTVVTRTARILSIFFVVASRCSQLLNLLIAAEVPIIKIGSSKG